MRVLLIDGNNLVHRNAHVLSSLTTSSGMPVGGFYGYIRSLRFALTKYQELTPIVVWDSASIRRHLISSGSYKSHRRTIQTPEQIDTFQTIMNNLEASQEITKLLGIPSIRVKRVECDDVIACIARAASEAVILSTDKDYYQLLHFDHILLDRGKDDNLSKSNFKERHHQTPLQYRLCHILTGDAGDGISGIPGFGFISAQRFASQFSDETLFPIDLNTIFYASKESSSKKMRLVWEHSELVEYNYFLIDLLEVVQLDASSKRSIQEQCQSFGGIDYAGVARMFHQFEFSSLEGDFQSKLLRSVEHHVFLPEEIRLD